MTPDRAADRVVREGGRWRSLLQGYAELIAASDTHTVAIPLARGLWDCARAVQACQTRADELGADRIGPGARIATDLREIVASLERPVEIEDSIEDGPSVALREQLEVWRRRQLSALATVSPPVADPAPTESDPDGWTTEILERNLDELELGTMEQTCRILLDFPDAPPALLVDMARQCWDEARHAQLLIERLAELGRPVAVRPVRGSRLAALCAGRPLALRLAMHQRWGEWSGVCGARWHRAAFAARGDLRTALIFDWIEADEILHVAQGNHWIRFLVPDLSERAQLDQDAEVLRRAAGRSAPPLLPFPHDRSLALRCGFDDRDLDRLDALYQAHGSRFPAHRSPE